MVVDPKPSVSFLVAAHQAGSTLPALVGKVLGQAGSSRAVEIVISPDCPENYRALLPADPRITFAEAGLSSGPPAARNRALEAAQGKHVCLLDSDDDVSDDFVQGILAALSVHPAFCLRTVYESGGRRFKAFPGAWSDYSTFRDYYGSLQPVLPRGWVAGYPACVAEDVVVTMAALYRSGGRLPVIDAQYVAKIRDDSFCAANAERFSQMYREAISSLGEITLGLGVPGVRAELERLFTARLEMSEAFDEYLGLGGQMGYHDFVGAALERRQVGRSI